MTTSPYELRHEKNLSSVFPTISDTNQDVHPYKMARFLTLWIQEVKGY